MALNNLMFGLRMFKKIVFLASISASALFAPELRWDWSKIDLSKITLPKELVWGVAQSEYQCSGAENCGVSNWSAFEQSGRVPKSGVACDSYNRMDDDVAKAKALGVKAFRFSLAWEKIEPKKGHFDGEAIKHYQLFCDKLVQAGMQPVVTLHHFVHPLWFEEMGAFEQEDNIQYFVRFSTNMFKALKDHGVTTWCTINEPGVYVFQGYIHGEFPPGKTSDFKQAGQVAYNLIRAHTETYNAIKKCKGGDVSNVGFTHSITLFEPYHDTHPGEKIVTQMVNHWFHDAITQYVKTGKFKWYVPGVCRSISIDDTQDDLKPKLDFIGLQYYSHVLMNFPYIWPREYLSYVMPQNLVQKMMPTHDGFKFGVPAYRKGEIPTDMPYCIYPEGMYRAIKLMGEIKGANGKQIPIIISEMGIADAKDDRRAHMIRTHLYAISQAAQEGADIRGIFYWSLKDNYEWNLEYKKKFGLYEVDFQTKEAKLRQGALAYIEAIKRHEEEHKIQ